MHMKEDGTVFPISLAGSHFNFGSKQGCKKSVSMNDSGSEVEYFHSTNRKGEYTLVFTIYYVTVVFPVKLRSVKLSKRFSFISRKFCKNLAFITSH